MKWLILIPIFIFAILQTTAVSFNFILILLLLAALIGLEAESILGAFVAGIILDISGGTLLGLSSIAYFVCLFPVFIYQRRFRSQNPLYWVILFIASAIIFNLITGRGFYLGQVGIFALAGIVFYLLLARFEMVSEMDDGIRLKV